MLTGTALASAAEVASSVLVAGENLEQWTVTTIETHIGENRVEYSSEGIKKLARGIRVGDCNFENIVTILGGRQASNKRGHGAETSAAGRGREGEFEGDNAPQDVEKALSTFGEIMRDVQGVALNGPLCTERDYGLSQLVADGYGAIEMARRCGS